MNLQNLTSSDLKEITRLIQKKESLLGEISKIDKQLDSMQPGAKPKARAAAKAPTRRKRKAKPKAKAKAKKAKAASKKPVQRGQTKERILSLLRQAGAKGITVKEVAQKLGSTQNSVGVWFYTTGKKIKEIKKIAPATYAYKG